MPFITFLLIEDSSKAYKSSKTTRVRGRHFLVTFIAYCNLSDPLTNTLHHLFHMQFQALQKCIELQNMQFYRISTGVYQRDCAFSRLVCKIQLSSSVLTILYATASLEVKFTANPCSRVRLMYGVREGTVGQEQALLIPEQ